MPADTWRASVPTKDVFQDNGLQGPRNLVTDGGYTSP